MTVCVAALASSGSCIICIADKALSYGEYLQWDSDTTKIIALSSQKSVLMVSGGEDSSRVVSSILAMDDIGIDISDSIKKLEKIYQNCYDEVVEIKFLKQNGLLRDEYIKALTAPQINKRIERIAEQIERFELDCDVLVCGYDQSKSPFILSVSSPGKVVDVTREGLHAIGSGYDHAIARLLMLEHKRTNGVAETLYECFDAKAHAELASSVGYEWDAYILSGAGVVPIEEEIKPLFDKVWAQANRSPFYKRQKDDLPIPPRNWKSQMIKIVGKALGKLGVPTLKGKITVISGGKG